MLRKLSLIFLVTILSAVVALVPGWAVNKSLSFQAEIWADNWFSLYVNGKKVGEDSTPFATERSFNSDKFTFKATYPLTIAIVARDYVENGSGLEYIGRSNQQIGDGGLIAQIRDLSSREIVGGTNSQWRARVTNKAPLNPDCVKSRDPLTDCKTSNSKFPKGWFSKTFKDAAWDYATEFTASQVGVKEGYFDYTWGSETKLVWSSDLKLDNTILLRGKISAPTSVSKTSAVFKVGSPDFVSGQSLPRVHTCDGDGISPALTFTGVPKGTQSLAVIMDTIPGPLRPGEVDIGNHFYLTIYNIPPTTILIPAGSSKIGTLGQNFQGKKIGYTPPCSQGAGIKEYTIWAFALSELLTLDPTLATENALLKLFEGKVLAKTSMTVKYQRP